MDRGAWQATVRGVTRVRCNLRDYTTRERQPSIWQQVTTVLKISLFFPLIEKENTWKKKMIHFLFKCEKKGTFRAEGYSRVGTYLCVCVCVFIGV